MASWFPTFRRWSGITLPIPVFWPRRRTTWAQQQSLLRLLATGIEEFLPLSPLVAAWAVDEYGIQKYRLLRLAELLHAGTPLPEAVEEVPGVLGDEDVLAIRFGAQSGTLVASMRERVEEPSPASSAFSLRLRKLLLYVCVLLFVGFFLLTFLYIKIVPELNNIISEFSVSEPSSLAWSRAFGDFVTRYWYLFALVIIAVYWLTFTSWPGRRMRRAILARLFRPLRELHKADVLDKLSVVTEAGRPITSALSTLARYHFDPMLRHQLLFIRNELEQGADVWQSMASIGFLNPPEALLLATSDRVGNRSWVLKQIALVKKRRITRRLGQLSELALPVVILLLGGIVLIQALGIFGPLVQIIYSLL